MQVSTPIPEVTVAGLAELPDCPMSNDVGLVLDSVVQAQPLVPGTGPGPRNGRLGIKVDWAQCGIRHCLTAHLGSWAAGQSPVTQCCLDLLLGLGTASRSVHIHVDYLYRSDPVSPARVWSAHRTLIASCPFPL